MKNLFVMTVFVLGAGSAQASVEYRYQCNASAPRGKAQVTFESSADGKSGWISLKFRNDSNEYFEGNLKTWVTSYLGDFTSVGPLELNGNQAEIKAGIDGSHREDSYGLVYMTLFSKDQRIASGNGNKLTCKQVQ